MPSRQNKKRYTHWRHGFFLAIFRFVFGPFFKGLYRFKAPKISLKKEGPFLILANHTSEFDIIFMDMLFDVPLYFVASDQLLNSGFGSWFLKYFFNPIPKSKSMADLGLVRRMANVRDEGGSIALYPEGNATMHGDAVSIPQGIGRLIKFLNMPVLILHIHGLYLSSPRWAYYRKYGPSTIVEHTRLYPKDFADQSAEALQTWAEKQLNVSAYEAPKKFLYHGKKRAEGLHKLLFMCPSCKTAYSTYSQGDTLKCRSCSFVGYYDQDGMVTIDSKRWTLPQLDDQNRASFIEYVHHHPELSLEYVGEVAFWDGVHPRRTAFQRVHLHASLAGITLRLKSKQILYTNKQVLSVAIQVRTKLIVYVDDGQTLLFRFPKAQSPYAMMMLIQLAIKTQGGTIHDPHTRRTLKTVLGL